MPEHKKEDAAVLSLLILYLLVFLPSHFASAQGLVPCGIDRQCQLCDLVVLVQNVINFIILYLAAPVATLLIAWAGIKLIVNAENEGERTKAKQLLKDILVGFLWVLCAWFVVILIINTLVNTTGVASKDSPWFRIECNRPAYGPLDTELDQPGVMVITPSGIVGAYSQIQALERLNGKAAVKDGVSLNGISPSAINEVVYTKQACPTCNLTVTSGLEGTHSTNGDYTHANGYKIDLRLDPKLDAYVAKNFTTCDTCIRSSDNAKLYTDPQTKAIWAREGDHWDIQVTKNI